MKITGLQELQRELCSVANGVREVDGPHGVPLTDLVPPHFMPRYGLLIGEMVKASGFQVRSTDNFERIPGTDWDTFVASRTRFCTWEQMLQTASAEYLHKKVGVGVNHVWNLAVTYDVLLPRGTMYPRHFR